MLLELSLVVLVIAGEPRHEPIVGGPCEGCEAVFEGMPHPLYAEARVAPAGFPGEPMVLAGTVFDANDAPAAGVIVYAYHTDAAGVYPGAREGRTAGQRHGRLRGWVRTDAQGRYRFATIRPAAYPGRSVPAHVHLHVIEPGRATYFIDDVVFDDDPLLTADARRRYLTGRGGSGLTHPARDGAGVWQVERHIRLGERVPGYER